MRRGELYRVQRPSSRDPRKYRVFVIVSRQTLIESRFATVVCAPVFSSYDGLSTQVPIGPEEGMKHECSIHCDELVSLPKSALTHYIAVLSPPKLRLLDEALKAALELSEDHS
jgi:mRNA interferase MazF